MNTLLLHPTDILFFRDGRPMSGSLAGHGAAWPLPTVLNAALHAALWRADLENVHRHAPGRSSDKRDHSVENREANGRKFGSLLTTGPFPVSPQGEWFFPRPADAQDAGTAAVTLKPAKLTGTSSLASFLKYGVANTRPPTKDKPALWWNAAAWQAYLAGGTEKVVQVLPPANLPSEDMASRTQNHPAAYPEGKAVPLYFANDTDFADTEHTIGIGIDPDTGTQDGERFYSAHYLRLREGWRMGAFAEAKDKNFKDKGGNNDLIAALFPNSGAETPIIIGGQQRLCTVARNVARHSNVESALPLPQGATITGIRVKWILLTPAVWPEIGGHKGGWLPSWIRHTDGQVMLKAGDTSRHEKEGRETWRKRVAGFTEIPARLVAALLPKPIPVTGYALPHEATGDSGGAKPTHLAVPAGAVYYFESDNEDAAKALAAALNWHGGGPGDTIRNRRSTLFGEKGFGLGVCGTWDFHPTDIPGHPSN